MNPSTAPTQYGTVSYKNLESTHHKIMKIDFFNTYELGIYIFSQKRNTTIDKKMMMLRMRCWILSQLFSSTKEVKGVIHTWLKKQPSSFNKLSIYALIQIWNTTVGEWTCIWYLYGTRLFYVEVCIFRIRVFIPRKFHVEVWYRVFREKAE